MSSWLNLFHHDSMSSQLFYGCLFFVKFPVNHETVHFFFHKFQELLKQKAEIPNISSEAFPQNLMIY